MSETAEPGVATSPVSESALLEMFALVIVPAKFWMSMPSASVWLITLLVIVTTPVRFAVVVRLSSNVMLFSSVASPAPVIVPSVKLNPFTWVPLTPLSPVFRSLMFRNDGLRRVRERDAVAGGALDRAAGVVAALRRAAACR